MKFKLEITNTEKEFSIAVLHGPKIVHRCGWKGSEFYYQGKHYAVYGPYHSLWNDDKYRVVELVLVSEAY